MSDNSEGQKPKSEIAGLVADSDATEDKSNFTQEVENTLKQTEQAVLDQRKGMQDTKSWSTARAVVEKFQPVPWFIWRISNYVLGQPGEIKTINEGFVLGLRRLLFATASDATLGCGQKINDVKKALKIISPDVVASVAVIHAVCRKFSSKEFERIWRPILDDAILRCQIGALVCANDAKFGKGRGMLAGFASRAGLVTLLSSGDLDQARQALELLASGKEISDVGSQVYHCNPLQVSAMLLSASGCGRDAAFGTVSYAYQDATNAVENKEQLKWLAAFSITENVRIGKAKEVDEKLWHALDVRSSIQRDEISEQAKKLVRRGHDWSWLL